MAEKEIQRKGVDGGKLPFVFLWKNKTDYSIMGAKNREFPVQPAGRGLENQNLGKEEIWDAGGTDPENEIIISDEDSDGEDR